MKKVYTVKELKAAGVIVLGYKDSHRFQYKDLPFADQSLMRNVE